MSIEMNQSLAKIAKKCRIDKKNGLFKSYRDSYRAAVDSTLKNKVTVKQLENAYYNSKRSKGMNQKK